VICSTKIKDFPVTIQDIDVALKIWGKNIAALKGKNNWSKTNPEARDYVNVPKELLKLHKEVYDSRHLILDQDSFLLYT
jgi:hypothetical protein